MEHQETINAPEVARLVRGAANGDWRAWDRLVNQYQELVAAAREATMASDDETLRELPRHETRIESLRATEPARAAGNVLSSLPPRWQQLLGLLSADPPAQRPHQHG